MARGNKCNFFSYPLIAATLLAVPFAARGETTYSITSYPAGLADLPSDAFKRVVDAGRHSHCGRCSHCRPKFQEYQRDAYHREQVR
jgi:hypothetical protein